MLNTRQQQSYTTIESYIQSGRRLRLKRTTVSAQFCDIITVTTCFLCWIEWTTLMMMMMTRTGLTKTLKLNHALGQVKSRNLPFAYAVDSCFHFCLFVCLLVSSSSSCFGQLNSFKSPQNQVATIAGRICVVCSLTRPNSSGTYSNRLSLW